MQRRSRLLEIADRMTKKVYKETLQFPYKHQHSLGDQLRRASLSVVLNIVESAARETVKEKKRLLVVSFASLKETKYLLYLAKDLTLVSDEFYQKVYQDTDELSRLLYGILYKKV